MFPYFFRGEISFPKLENKPKYVYQNNLKKNRFGFESLTGEFAHPMRKVLGYTKVASK